MVLFAVALTMALGTVLMMIAASSVQAMSHSAVFNAKADDWVGLAAMGSVLVCAFLGVIIVHRYSGLHLGNPAQSCPLRPPEGPVPAG